MRQDCDGQCLIVAYPVEDACRNILYNGGTRACIYIIRGTDVCARMPGGLIDGFTREEVARMFPKKTYSCPSGVTLGRVIKNPHDHQT